MIQPPDTTKMVPGGWFVFWSHFLAFPGSTNSFVFDDLSGISKKWLH